MVFHRFRICGVVIIICLRTQLGHFGNQFLFMFHEFLRDFENVRDQVAAFLLLHINAGQSFFGFIFLGNNPCIPKIQDDGEYDD